MESAEFNQQLFYKLIREQRSTGQTDTDIIVIDDMILNTDEMILNGWNAHFERLSTPDISHHNNMDYSELECELIEQIIIDPKKRKKLPDITTGEVKKAICKLANGKAPDHLGMTAEHYKIGGNIISEYIAGILNKIKNMVTIPEILKTALLTPGN